MALSCFLTRTTIHCNSNSFSFRQPWQSAVSIYVHTQWLWFLIILLLCLGKCCHLHLIQNNLAQFQHTYLTSGHRVPDFISSVIATHKSWQCWHVLQLNTWVLACIATQYIPILYWHAMPCLVVCIGSMYWIQTSLYSILTGMHSIHISLFWCVLRWYYKHIDL